MAIRKIKSFEEEFTVGEFPERAQEIYIKAHEALARYKYQSNIYSC